MQQLSGGKLLPWRSYYLLCVSRRDFLNRKCRRLHELPGRSLPGLWWTNQLQRDMSGRRLQFSRVGRMHELSGWSIPRIDRSWRMQRLSGGKLLPLCGEYLLSMPSGDFLNWKRRKLHELSGRSLSGLKWSDKLQRDMSGRDI